MFNPLTVFDAGSIGLLGLLTASLSQSSTSPCLSVLPAIVLVLKHAMTMPFFG